MAAQVWWIGRGGGRSADPAPDRSRPTLGGPMIPAATIAMLAYLLGSVPFGVLVARLQGGVDLRRVGSGNIGATNVLRVLGRQAAALTLLGDVGKGMLPVLLGRWLEVSSAALAVIALTAVAGHLFPVFTGFRGGKGVATTLGVVLAAMPMVGGVVLLVWLGVAARWRYSSLAALAASAALPFATWLLDGRAAMLVLGGALFAVSVWRHRENIRRLRAGTEAKIGERVGVPGNAARE